MERMTRSLPRLFPDERHDHAACVADAIARATEICAARKARLTPLRKRVLELVWSGHKPVGAYEILSMLQRDQPGAAPPTVYRALDFLMVQGLIHRVERLNAFIGCIRPDDGHAAQILICRSCRRAAEIADPRLDAAIQSAVDEMGFEVEKKTIEVEGLCAACRGRAASRGDA
jgi:Fur family transcriptional regulator, zinc uptake regulator